MKKGLVMEGGAMRGMFTAGVIDVLMESGIEFDGAIGVSAGAAFGCNYKSKQIGRVIRYNTRFCRDKRYCGIGSLIKTGDLYNAEFCYHVVPFEYDIFDLETFNNNPMEFHVVCTDVTTGEAVYRKCDDAREAIEWMRASASMPVLANVVELDGMKLLDGGIADAIPLRYFESIGYEKNIVVLTRPYGYVKKKQSLMWVLKLALKKYPKVTEKLKKRHTEYNELINYICSREKTGDALVIRPPEKLPIGKMERNPENLRKAYDMGRKEAEKRLSEIRGFLS